MRKKRNNFRLGIAVIVMFALLVFCLLFIGGSELRHPKLTTVTVRFAPGGVMPEIAEGSKVMALGQKVGKVSSTKIVEAAGPGDETGATSQYLEVVARVRHDLNLREDCQIIATGPPLGGKGTLEIIGRGQSETPVDEDVPVYGSITGFQAALDMINKELDSRDPASLISFVKTQLNAEDKESLIAKIHQSLGDINVMTGQLAREMDANHDDRVLFKLHEGLDSVNSGLAQLTTMIADNRPKIDNTLTSVEHAAATADTDVISALAIELDPNREGNLMSQVHRSFAAINTSLDDINVVTGESRRLVVLNSSRIEELVQNVSEASMILRNGLKDLAIHPWKLLTKPTPAEQKQLKTIQVAREFSEAAAHLDDASIRLKALLEANQGEVPADDPTLREISANLSSTIKRFGEAEEALWNALNID